MAAYTLTPGNVIHTLSPRCVGINQGVYFYTDMDSTFFRQLCVEAGFEIFRTFTVGNSTTYGFYSSSKNFHLYMQTQLGGSYGAMLGTPVIPSPQPASVIDPVPVVSTDAGYSIADHQALFQDWINAGVDVMYWQFVNEPHLNASDHEGNALLPGTPWFGDGSAPLADRNKCNDWIMVRHREVFNSYTQKISDLARTGLTRVLAEDEAQITGDVGYSLVKNFILGVMNTSGAPNPNSPASNVGFLDIESVHTYYSPAPDDQAWLNAVFWNEATSESDYLTNHAHKGSFVAPFRWLRALLDANGGSAVSFGISESGSDGKTSSAPVRNVASAIAFCQKAGDFKLLYLVTHAMTRTATTGADEQFILASELTPDPFETLAQVDPGRRYYAFRDLWGRYMRLYKSQVAVTVNTAPGNTPATTENNAVPRIQVVAGKNSAGTTLAIMLANIDKTSTEQVTLSWGTAATANITGFRCPVDQGASALPTITPFGSGVTSFTTGSGGAPSIAAGDSYLFEIPISLQQGDPLALIHFAGRGAC